MSKLGGGGGMGAYPRENMKFESSNASKTVNSNVTDFFNYYLKQRVTTWPSCLTKFS